MGRSGPAGHLDRSRIRRPCSGPRSSPARKSSPTRSARPSTSSARRSFVATSAWSAAASATSPAPTTPCSSRSADRQAHVAGRRSPRRQAPAPDRGCQQAERRRTRVQAGAAAADRDVQEGRCGLRRRQVSGRCRQRRNELPPLYNTGRLNRNDGPEDRSLTERCIGAVLPDFGGYRRIVQTPGAVAIFYDTGQGQGWQRVIPDRLPVPICRHRFASASATHVAAGRAIRWSSTSPTSRRGTAIRRRATTCIWSSGSGAPTPTRSSTR